MHIIIAEIIKLKEDIILLNDNQICRLAIYIDNEYVCKVKGDKCNCTPDGVPCSEECLLHDKTSKEESIFMEV